MNYSVLVTGVVVGVSVVYYLIWGRKVFKGPLVDVETSESEDIRR